MSGWSVMFLVRRSEIDEQWEANDAAPAGPDGIVGRRPRRRWARAPGDCDPDCEPPPEGCLPEEEAAFLAAIARKQQQMKKQKRKKRGKKAGKLRKQIAALQSDLAECDAE